MTQTSEKKSYVAMETSMIRDFARRVIDDFGDQTDSYVASRIGVLIRDGDSYGVGLWKAVASEIERIRLPEAHMPRSHH
jgi:hypothetical protein